MPSNPPVAVARPKGCHCQRRSNSSAQKSVRSAFAETNRDADGETSAVVCNLIKEDAKVLGGVCNRFRTMRVTRCATGVCEGTGVEVSKLQDGEFQDKCPDIERVSGGYTVDVLTSSSLKSKRRTSPWNRPSVSRSMTPTTDGDETRRPR